MNLIEIERHRNTVTTRYGVTSYLDMGAGPPALFVHGLATSAHLWRNLVPRLADQRRWLALDFSLKASPRSSRTSRPRSGCRRWTWWRTTPVAR